MRTKGVCPHCGALLVENASFCPYCESVLIEKRPAEMPKPKRRRRITAALLLAAILVVTLAAVGFADHGKVIDAQGAELTYETDGQTFHLALSFESQGDAPFFGQPLFTVEVREDQVRGQVSSSRVFVDNGGGVDKKNEFLALVDHYEVTTTPCDGVALLQIDETFLPTNSNAAIEAIPSYHTEQLKEGEGNVIWTIYLKNGDTLRLRHTVKITRVPVVTLMSGPDSVFDERFNESVRLLGTIFEESEKAETLIGFIAAERAGIEARTADIAEEDKPAVYICGLGNWGTTNHLMTAQDYVSFRVANVKNVVSDLGAPGAQPIEAEKFVALGENMDAMIFDAAAVKNIKPLYAEDPTMFDTCRAWREGEAYLQLAYNAYYTNYEIALINTWFAAKTAYPDRFEDVDMTEVTDRVTTAFLGKPLAEEIYACPNSFGGYQKIDTATFFAGTQG